MRSTIPSEASPSHPVVHRLTEVAANTPAAYFGIVLGCPASAALCAPPREPWHRRGFRLLNGGFSGFGGG